MQRTNHGENYKIKPKSTQKKQNITSNMISHQMKSKYKSDPSSGNIWDSTEVKINLIKIINAMVGSTAECAYISRTVFWYLKIKIKHKAMKIIK